MLKGLAALEPKAQEKSLFTTFENWKGNLELVDDVTIIGISV